MTNRAVLVESYPDIEPGNVLTEAHARELRARGISTSWVDEVDADLPRVLASLDHDDRVVIAETNPTAVEMLGETVRQFDAGLLWWDGWCMRDLPPHPVDPVRSRIPRCRMAGAGIDMSGFALASTSEAHISPLELLHVGWPADPGTLTVVLRALATAHARGANVRLTVCADELDDAVDPTMLAFLAEDFAVGRSVTSRDRPPTGEALSRFHGLLDLSNAEPVNGRFLEAMACGVPVVSSNKGLAPLVDEGPVPLGFPPGDVQQLAARIVDLSHVGYENFQDLRARVRADIVSHHSLGVWADTVVAAMTNQELPVVALPAPASTLKAVVATPSWPAAVSPTATSRPRTRRSAPVRLGKVAVVAGLTAGAAIGTYALVGGGSRATVFEPGVHAITPTTVATTTLPTTLAPTTGLGVTPVVGSTPPTTQSTGSPGSVAVAPSATTPSASASASSAELSPPVPTAGPPQTAPSTTPSPPTTVVTEPAAPIEPAAPTAPTTIPLPTAGPGRGRGRG